MKTINDFLGNQTQVKQLCDWLNKFYHEPTSEVQGYAIVYGPSGNGKTLLGKLLANSFEVELMLFTPLDTNVDDIIKSINMKTLDGMEHKLILIDDLDEFPSNMKKKLFELSNISNHPIIYTCKGLFFPPEFISKGLVVKIKKPLTTEIYDHLKTISNLPPEKLMEIAKDSPSVRSAELSTYNASVNDLTNPTQTNYDVFKNAKARSLSGNLGRGKVAYLFSCIEGYDLDALKVRGKFAEFDYRTKVKFEEIDSYFINYMREPIEKVLKYQKYNEKEKDKEKSIDLRSIKKKEVKQPSLEDW